MKGDYSKLANQIISQIKFEVDQIDQLLKSYTELLEKTKKSEPNLVEITAIASVLHSFYNGVENIFLSIAKGIDEHLPEGIQWHRDLLIQMTQQNPKRNRVITEEMTQKLVEYLGFRHFYRHSYSFFLEWDELKKLVNPIQDIWTDLKKELFEFIDSISSCWNENIEKTKWTLMSNFMQTKAGVEIATEHIFEGIINCFLNSESSGFILDKISTFLR